MAAQQKDVSAEALVEQIGPRGQTGINSSNRNPVRRWLVARGVDSPTARQLSLAELRRVYNDTTDGALMAYLSASNDEPEPRARKADSGGQPEPTPTLQPDTSAAGVAQAAQQAMGNSGDTAQQLAALITQLAAGQSQQSAGMDEDRVVELIEQHAPVQRAEIKRPDGTTKTLEGRQHYALPKLLTMLSAGLNVWLCGPAGSGKTTLAEKAAEAMELDFYSTGAVTSDFRLMGFIDAKGQTVRTPFRDAFEHGGIFLWDEIDASHPNALTAFNQAISNGRFAFPDGMVEKHPDFVCIAAANTWGFGPTSEYVGRQRIDAATLDRFAKLHIDYDEELERAMAGQFEAWAKAVQAARDAARSAGIKAVISPRATKTGAQLLAAGMDPAEVAEATVRNGMDDTSWAKVSAALDQHTRRLI